MTQAKTLFDKIWEAHLVDQQDDGTCLIGRVRFFAILLCCCFLCAPFPVRSESKSPFKANSLVFVEWCTTNLDGCRAYTVAMRGALAAYSEKATDIEPICVPNPIAGDELTGRIIERIKNEPKFHSLSGEKATMAVIEEDYTCQK